MLPILKGGASRSCVKVFERVYGCRGRADKHTQLDPRKNAIRLVERGGGEGKTRLESLSPRSRLTQHNVGERQEKKGAEVNPGCVDSSIRTFYQ